MNGYGVLNHLEGGQRIEKRGQFVNGRFTDGQEINADRIKNMKVKYLEYGGPKS